MFFIDPLYIALALPGLLLGLWAQWRVKRAFSEYSEVGTRRGLSGAEVAADILRTEQIRDVRIEETHGWLSDHYSPGEKTLRLSPDVYHGRSIAAAGVAAHEVGHAVQHARSYPFLGMRSTLVPAVQFASPFAVPIIIVGFLLSGFVGSAIGQLVTIVGLALFALVVLFQLVTLPVEFDASRRALAAIERGGLLAPGDEQEGARAVLKAAAWTYVAAAVSAVLTLLYFVLRSGLLGGSRD
ncbi:MAG TPA: zinc metallopeptidase [Sandaracinaceae bacterium LLY-WYZ-13_1]|nr:zinc metallopeptidase [Sandaracinaceae bacterium LLY-WYZ-13_1]